MESNPALSGHEGSLLSVRNLPFLTNMHVQGKTAQALATRCEIIQPCFSLMIPQSNDGYPSPSQNAPPRPPIGWNDFQSLLRVHRQSLAWNCVTREPSQRKIPPLLTRHQQP